MRGKPSGTPARWFGGLAAARSSALIAIADPPWAEARSAITTAAVNGRPAATVDILVMCARAAKQPTPISNKPVRMVEVTRGISVLPSVSARRVGPLTLIVRVPHASRHTGHGSQASGRSMCVSVLRLHLEPFPFHVAFVGNPRPSAVNPGGVRPRLSSVTAAEGRLLWRHREWFPMQPKETTQWPPRSQP